MLIGIDESGTFLESDQRGSWSAVAAYTFTERRKTRNTRALARLKSRCRVGAFTEIKLRDVEESDYFAFLSDLHDAGGGLFAVATDGAFAKTSVVECHRDQQALNIRENVPRMKYEGGRTAVRALADEIQSLSGQLYVQLQCQVTLLHDIVMRALLFYVQRDPKTLRRFVWRIDQKNTNKSRFEYAFEKIAPGLLQTMSFGEPMMMLKGADYSYFDAFRFSSEEYPEHLVKSFGHPPQETTNIGKLLREDLCFPDSKEDQSVQIADLLAAGLRRCLRGQFASNRDAATLLGRLMVQNAKPEFPLHFVQFSNMEVTADQAASASATLMRKHAQPMLLSA